MKKTLILIRHAKSSWDNPDLNDHDRPLNERGKKDAPNMGERLAVLKYKPDLLITSTAKRAVKTAQKIAAEIGYPSRNLVKRSSLYHADPAEILHIIHECEDQHNTLALVGHNPGFTEFANWICNQDIENIPTCGIFITGFSVTSWKQVKPGTGERILFDYPKKPFRPEL
jgi:phosphohistidine phosphatase